MNVIEFAETKKRAARRKRKSGDFDAAVALVVDAIAALEAEQTRLSGEVLSGERGRKLLAAIADAYGSKGGILRSAQRYDESCEAYDHGYAFEQKEAANSYNLTQRLLARFFAVPQRLLLETWQDGDVSYPASFEEAERAIDEQIAGPRLNDPWAIADRAMILLLLGRTVSEETALWARFQSLSPQSFVYSSTLGVVEDLQNRIAESLLASTEPRVSAVRARLDGVAAFLRGHIGTTS